MTVKLSPQKVSKILRFYFHGLPQVKIAKKSGVKQSTVSQYGKKFAERAEEVGLLAAAKEFNVFDEVDSLRSLAVELEKSKLIPDDAKEGVKIIKVFNRLGIKPSAHTTLVKVCKEVKDPSFVNAALKLAKIEAESHINYEEAMTRFEEITAQLPLITEQFEKKKGELESANTNLAATEEKLEKANKAWEELENAAQKRIKKKQHEYDVATSEIEMVAKLKADLEKKGLDIPTLVKMAQEF